MTTPTLPPSPFTLAHAAQLGISDGTLRRLLAAQTLISIRPGVFWLAKEFDAATARNRHLLLARRVATDLEGEFALARETAALVHDLWTPRRRAGGPPTVSLYSLDNRNVCKRNGVHVMLTPLFDGDLVEFEGFTVTSIRRTCIDLARGMALPYALIALDCARRIGVAEDELLDLAQRMKQWRGTKQLRMQIPLANPLSESPLESATRGTALAAGLPAPELQVPVQGASGANYRADLVWPGARLVVEADGIEKYGETEAERRTNFEREKAREDDLREADYAFIRVTWKTLSTSASRIAARLRRSAADAVRV